MGVSELAIVFLFFLLPITVLVVIFGFILLLKRGSERTRTLVREDDQRLGDLLVLLEKMEQRIDNLETILGEKTSAANRPHRHEE